MSRPTVRRPSYYEYVCVGCSLFDEGEYDRTYRYTYNMEKHLWRHIEEGDIISAKDFKEILNMKVDYEEDTPIQPELPFSQVISPEGIEEPKETD